MSAPDPKKWMPLHIGPYERATNRLSLAEDGAYMRLLRDYWVNGAPPDDDAQLARILRVERREWAKIRPAIIRFFEVRDGHWFQERMEAELAKARAITEARRAAGQKGGKGKSKQEAIASDMLEQNETPARVASPLPLPTELEEADASSVGSAEPMPTGGKPKAEPWAKDADFGKFWDAATAKMRARAKSKAKVWPEWKIARKWWSAADLIAALSAYLKGDPDVGRTGGPGLHLWLRDKTFESWVRAEAAPAAPWPGPPEILAILTAHQLGGYAAYLAWRDVPERAVVTSSATIHGKLQACADDLGKAGVGLILEPGRAVA